MMKKNKILVIEGWMTGNQHIEFNSGFLSILEKSFKGYNLYYFGERKQNAILSKKHNNFIFFNIINVFFTNKIYLLPILDFFTIINYISLLLKSKRKDIVFICNKLVFAHIFYNILNIFFRRKTYIVLHGEMEVFVNPLGIGHTKHYFRLHRLGFLINKCCTKYICLGESIKKNILKNKILKEDRLLTIDHPYDYEYVNLPVKFDLPLKLVIIGRASLQKKSFLIFKLAELLEKEIKYNLLNIKIVGGVDNNILKYENNLVSYEKNSKMLDDLIYQKKIAYSHYIVCFFDHQIYKAIPSGTFFDSLKYEKPILFIKGNDFLDYYYSRFGDIGESYLDLEEMALEIKNKIINIKEESSKYQAKIQNIIKSRKDLSIESISNQFKKQL